MNAHQVSLLKAARHGIQANCQSDQDTLEELAREGYLRREAAQQLAKWGKLFALPIYRLTVLGASILKKELPAPPV